METYLYFLEKFGSFIDFTFRFADVGQLQDQSGSWLLNEDLKR